MKKLKFNSTLNHKQSYYKTREIIVEKEITLYGRSFSELKDYTKFLPAIFIAFCNRGKYNHDEKHDWYQ